MGQAASEEKYKTRSQRRSELVSAEQDLTSSGLRVLSSTSSQFNFDHSNKTVIFLDRSMHVSGKSPFYQKVFHSSLHLPAHRHRAQAWYNQ